MKAQFLEMADSTNLSQDNPWVLVASLANPSIEVYKLQNTDFCVKVIAELNCTMETAFDLLSDITRRVEWDDLCEESGIIEVIDNATKIQFMRTKGVWPASPRDTLVLAHVERLPDGRYLNVAQSVEHPDCPPRDAENIVRMEAKISGQVVGPTLDNQPGMCRVVQVADGDLKGWIPKSVIGFIATKSVPNSFKKLDTILKVLEQKTVSTVLALAEGTADVVAQRKDEKSSEIEVDGDVAVGSVTDLPTPSAAAATSVTMVRRSVPKPRASLLSRIRTILDWWSPYMVTILFILKMHRLIKAKKQLEYFYG
ncbi:hypothetical protein SpCBS45565_g00172 [Spizellomyces sp. 'palustris']|nr:hypothetical protein SpCBS45565_g00172 [Spizellomyces sp. 'palustris']